MPFSNSPHPFNGINAATGEEGVYMAAHDDLVRDTVFSADSKSVFSVSRDKTVKMTDIQTQRFLCNVTTHTPGVLRGGMNAIERHPTPSRSTCPTAAPSALWGVLARNWQDPHMKPLALASCHRLLPELSNERSEIE